MIFTISMPWLLNLIISFWQIDLYPNLDAIIGLKDILDLFNEHLTVQSSEFQVTLAYDTTFQFRDFYVSPILFQHLYFEGSPLRPLVFLVHDGKYQLSHAKLFTKLLEKVPNLSKKRVQLIIPREKGIRNSAKTVPNLCPVLCWNHIWQDLKHWVCSHNGNSDDIHVYTDHLMQLLKSESPTEFEERYTELYNICTKKFDSYFLGQKDDLKMTLCKYCWPQQWTCMNHLDK